MMALAPDIFGLLVFRISLVCSQIVGGVYKQKSLKRERRCSIWAGKRLLDERRGMRPPQHCGLRRRLKKLLEVWKLRHSLHMPPHLQPLSRCLSRYQAQTHHWI